MQIIARPYTISDAADIAANAAARHTQGTDETLDLDGPNEVPAGTIKTMEGLYHTDVVIYSSTMTGNETFSKGDEKVRICFLDANGSSRNFNPSGTFYAGYSLHIVNTGSENIVFDSGVLNSTVASGKLGLFYYDGSIWH